VLGSGRRPADRRPVSGRPIPLARRPVPGRVSVPGSASRGRAIGVPAAAVPRAVNAGRQPPARGGDGGLERAVQRLRRAGVAARL